MAGRTGIRETIERILDVIEEYSDLALEMRVENNRIVLTADLGGKSAVRAARTEVVRRGPGRPARAAAHTATAKSAPAGEYTDKIVQILTEAGGWVTLKDLASMVVPGEGKTVLKPSLEALLKAHQVDFNRRAYRLAGLGRRRRGKAVRGRAGKRKVSASGATAEEGTAPAKRGRKPGRKPGRPKGSKNVRTTAAAAGRGGRTKTGKRRGRPPGSRRAKENADRSASQSTGSGAGDQRPNGE